MPWDGRWRVCEPTDPHAGSSQMAYPAVMSDGPQASDNPQVTVWNEVVGDTWATQADHFDAMLEPFSDAVLARLAVQPHERVVDIGCGAGANTVQLARIADRATVLGVDLSRPMLAAGRQRAATAGLANVDFAEHDVEAAPFGAAAFDVAFSRFGVMFFGDPVKAFTHVRESLVDGGRLGFVSYQGPSANPFLTVPVMAASAHLRVAPPPPPGAPGVFSFADSERVTAILAAAGFTDITHELGPDSMTLGVADDLPTLALRVMEQNPVVAAALSVASPAERSAAIDAVVAALAPHADGGHVRLAAGSWVVTATAG